MDKQFNEMMKLNNLNYEEMYKGLLKLSKILGKKNESIQIIITM